MIGLECVIAVFQKLSEFGEEVGPFGLSEHWKTYSSMAVLSSGANSILAMFRGSLLETRARSWSSSSWMGTQTYHGMGGSGLHSGIRASWPV